MKDHLSRRLDRMGKRWRTGGSATSIIILFILVQALRPITAGAATGLDGGATFTNIAGVTTTTLSVVVTVGITGARYRVVFSNACGTATTASAVLTVLDTCMKDDFSRN